MTLHTCTPRNPTPRSRVGGLAALALSALALGACESASSPTATSPASSASASSASAVAAEADRIGAAGTACELPVTIGLADSWKPEQVDIAADDPLAELARRGPLTTVCELDAKPAGHLGFLRVWTGKEQELRPAVEAFIGKDVDKPEYTTFEIGGRPALEVVYRKKSQLDDELEQERAFALQTSEGILAVSLDSFDDAEYEAMLPAYELARTTMTVTG